MFYFFSMMIAVYNLLLYAVFRSGIYSFLRLSKMSKTNMKKHRKGFKNYWLYRSINKQTSLGVLYCINIVFFIATIVYTAFALSFGLITNCHPIVLTLSVLLCLVEIPANIFASIYEYKAEFGKAFVLLAKRKETGKFCSSVMDMFSWIVTAFLIYLSYLEL